MNDWRNRAGCRTEDPELFFPVGLGAPAEAQERDAKAVCRRCPVQPNCLEWSMASRQEAGIWGGKTEAERRALAHNRQLVGVTP